MTHRFYASIDDIDLICFRVDYFYEDNGERIRESQCRFYKRLIVGLIQYFGDEDGEIVVPESCFEDVSSETGFDWSFYEDEEDDSIVRVFSVVEDWRSSIDDCGGGEPESESVAIRGTKLRLVPNEDP